MSRPSRSPRSNPCLGQLLRSTLPPILPPTLPERLPPLTEKTASLIQAPLLPPKALRPTPMARSWLRSRAVLTTRPSSMARKYQSPTTASCLTKTVSGPNMAPLGPREVFPRKKRPARPKRERLAKRSSPSPRLPRNSHLCRTARSKRSRRATTSPRTRTKTKTKRKIRTSRTSWTRTSPSRPPTGTTIWITPALMCAAPPPNYSFFFVSSSLLLFSFFHPLFPPLLSFGSRPASG